MVMGENRPITSRIGKAFVLETAKVKKKIKRDTGVIGLIFQRGLQDNLKKNIFIKNSCNRKKWDAKETSPNYTQKKTFL